MVIIRQCESLTHSHITELKSCTVKFDGLHTGDCCLLDFHCSYDDLTSKTKQAQLTSVHTDLLFSSVLSALPCCRSWPLWHVKSPSVQEKKLRQWLFTFCLDASVSGSQYQYQYHFYFLRILGFSIYCLTNICYIIIFSCYLSTNKKI